MLLSGFFDLAMMGLVIAEGPNCSEGHRRLSRGAILRGALLGCVLKIVTAITDGITTIAAATAAIVYITRLLNFQIVTATDIKSGKCDDDDNDNRLNHFLSS